MLVAHHPVGTDEDGFGHARNAELDARAPVAVDADAREGVAQLVQEALRVGRIVLIGDAVEGHPVDRRDLEEKGVLRAARRAP